jgi:hypothetical protein
MYTATAATLEQHTPVGRTLLPVAEHQPAQEPAEITSVPRAEARQVLTSANIGIATVLTLLPIPVGLASLIGGIAAGLTLGLAHPAVTPVCIIAGFVGAAASVLVLLRYQQFLPSRYLYSVARRAFSRRRDPLVRFNDPDVGFVDIVPRSNWGRTMLEPATDIGLFRIDPERRELLFEGDSKRYRIPFAAVAACEVEPIRLDADQWGNDLYYATVLTIDTETGPRELPLCGRHLTFQKRRMPQREQQAGELCTRILIALGS